ncbi:MAG TPA: hypothetical protein PLZ75_13120 [Bacteroidales bacterium]|nr:hypothetical protein [Bacteroidales bacterium]HQG57018.1 hypothetical protein [Bacteroidales bacterium]HQK72069.1 hypothetical protein [Bacteroidales bacterium]
MIYSNIDPGKLIRQYDRTVEYLTRGDFASAEVKKMPGTTGYYRAKLDQENHLLFTIVR